MTDPKTAPIIGITLIPSSINKAVKVKILELILAIIKLDILFEFLSLLLILWTLEIFASKYSSLLWLSFTLYKLPFKIDNISFFDIFLKIYP